MRRWFQLTFSRPILQSKYRPSGKPRGRGDPPPRRGPPGSSHLRAINKPRLEKHLVFHLNVTFPHLPCPGLAVEVMDVMPRGQPRFPLSVQRGLPCRSAQRDSHGDTLKVTLPLKHKRQRRRFQVWRQKPPSLPNPVVP